MNSRKANTVSAKEPSLGIRAMTRPSTFIAMLACWAFTFSVDAFTAREALVVSGHAVATEAGLEVMRQGGNAIDAAVAVSLVLGVAEPYGSGLGGKLAFLFYEAETASVYCLQALTAASERVRTDITRAQVRRGYISACVPGLPAGLYSAHRRWGTKPWPALVQPAIQRAREGVPVTPTMRDYLAEYSYLLLNDPEATKHFYPYAQPPLLGDRVPNEDLAVTLERYASHGAQGFYTGKTAESLVRAVQAGGGRLTLEDLASYRATFSEPFQIAYRGYSVYSPPPPIIGGPLYLLALKVLAQDAKRFSADDVEWMDQLARVMQQVYPVVYNVAADYPDSVQRTAALLNQQTARRLFDQAQQANPRNPFVGQLGYVDDEPSEGTTHFVIIDPAGNVVSATQSIGLSFGAGVIAPGTGFFLNNDMNNFAYFTPTSINFPAPGKRSRSSITPTLVLRDNRPVLAIGGSGGGRIPTAVLQATVRMLDLDMEPTATIAAPRFHLHRPMTRQDAVNQIQLEHGWPAALERQLRDRGWQPQRRTVRYFGTVNAAIQDADGKLIGAPDPRRSNTAGGY